MRSIRIPQSTIRNVRSGTTRRPDAPASRLLTTAMRTAWTDLDVDEVLHTLATGRDPELSARALEALAEEDVRCDPIGVHLLRRLGVDPVAAAIAAICADPDQIDLEGTNRIQHLGTMRRLTGSIPLTRTHADVVSWSLSSNQITKLTPLPETLTNAITGRPLVELISHPDLDGLKLRITSITATSIMTRIHTDHQPSDTPMHETIAEAVAT